MGTEKHRQKYADAINNFTVQGAFAMTEVGIMMTIQLTLSTTVKLTVDT